MTSTHTLGEIVSVFFQEFMELYGDAELASIAASATVTDLLSLELEAVDLESEEWVDAA